MDTTSARPRIAIFGGTFDPVHLGHLIVAEQCRVQAQLDQVWFVPAARPPHKLDRAITPFERRVEMLKFAIAGQPAFVVEELEHARPGPSYTADTLSELHQRHPDNAWHLIVGADCLPDLPSWYQPASIVELATLLVVARPSYPVWGAEELRQALGLTTTTPIRIQSINSPAIGIASRDIRQAVATGRSIRYQVVRAVECYILERQLYRNRNEM